MLGGLSHEAVKNSKGGRASKRQTTRALHRNQHERTTYLYDAEGRRLERRTNGTATRDWYYNRDGTTLIEIAPPYPLYQELYAAGMHIATRTLNAAHNGTDTYFHHADWLGTERARTDWAGNLCETVASLPFGDGETPTTTCPEGDISPMHFTGKERDLESGLDYFGARYNSSTFGRFMTPDWAAKPTAVPYANFGDPQSLNLYGYVRNNPVTTTDPNGHCDICLSVAMWVAQNVALEGPKHFASDVAVGAAKGAGQFAYKGASIIAAGGNPGAQLNVALDPGPTGLQPSNHVQAEVSAVTQVALGVASSVAPLAAASDAPVGITTLGDTFTHYGYLADADNFAGGLVPGSFATTESDLTGLQAQSGLALPNRPNLGPPNAAYAVTPEPGTQIVGPTPTKPAFGQPGGLPEVQFPKGTGPGTVGAPKQIPPIRIKGTP